MGITTGQVTQPPAAEYNMNKGTDRQAMQMSMGIIIKNPMTASGIPKIGYATINKATQIITMMIIMTAAPFPTLFVHAVSA
mgnify:CR=1 FL=1